MLFYGILLEIIANHGGMPVIAIKIFTGKLVEVTADPEKVTEEIGKEGTRNCRYQAGNIHWRVRRTQRRVHCRAEKSGAQPEKSPPSQIKSPSFFQSRCQARKGRRRGGKSRI